MITDYFTQQDFIAILIGLTVFVAAYYKVAFSYWKKRGVPTLSPTFPFGDSKDIILQKYSMGLGVADFYKKFKSMGAKHGGIYMAATPCYVPVHHEYVKNVLIRDFDHFVNHGTYYHYEVDPLNNSLLHIEDEEWKILRQILTPAFTSGKMKTMFVNMNECTKDLVKIIAQNAKNKNTVEILKIALKYTTDVIGSTALGIECKTLTSNDSHFGKLGEKILKPSKKGAFKLMSADIFPRKFLQLFRMKMNSNEVQEFFTNIVEQTVKYREENKIERKDYLQLLIQLCKDDQQNRGKVPFSISRLVAQAFDFFQASYETTATTMMFGLYELAANKDIQEKVREEIAEVLDKHNNEITYDSVMEMSYLDKVVQEALRKYPPSPFLRRRCNKDYLVPGTDVVIEKGTSVFIPAYAIHHDEEFYPNPDVFDPERFSKENKDQRPGSTWIPFGDGPRSCIGIRFGMLHLKVALLALVKNFHIHVNKKTIEPLDVTVVAPALDCRGGVWLDFEEVHH